MNKIRSKLVNMTSTQCSIYGHF